MVSPCWFRGLGFKVLGSRGFEVAWGALRSPVQFCARDRVWNVGSWWKCLGFGDSVDLEVWRFGGRSDIGAESMCCLLGFVSAIQSSRWVHHAPLCRIAILQDVSFPTQFASDHHACAPTR